ncbi:MAG: phosphopantetheine-binding protein [Spirochaetaceae bacterium]|nr:phosphopantetheine-binding protein [Spirochaetaceae bacterium]
MDTLKQELKQLIISSLDLEDVKVEDIADDEVLFGEGLELDSIDALELGIAIKKKYGVTFSAENEDNKKYFKSVSTLAQYITEKRNESK